MPRITTSSYFPRAELENFSTWARSALSDGKSTKPTDPPARNWSNPRFAASNCFADPAHVAGSIPPGEIIMFE